MLQCKLQMCRIGCIYDVKCINLQSSDWSMLIFSSLKFVTRQKENLAGDTKGMNKEMNTVFIVTDIQLFSWRNGRLKKV